MPPRFMTNPAPKTESARASLKSFYCELCSKGYSRQNEFDAHQSSYDHQHKKRLKDMKAMSKDPLAASKARKAEQKAAEKQGGGLIKISLGGAKDTDGGGGGGGGGEKPGGFKKGGFKSAFGSVDKNVDVKREGEEVKTGHVDVKTDIVMMTEEESDVEGVDYYDPFHPTGCTSTCKAQG